MKRPSVVGLSLGLPVAAIGMVSARIHRNTFPLGRNEMVNVVCFLINMIFELALTSEQSWGFPWGELRNYNFDLFCHFSFKSNSFLESCPNQRIILETMWLMFAKKPKKQTQTVLCISIYNEEIVTDVTG